MLNLNPNSTNLTNLHTTFRTLQREKTAAEASLPILNGRFEHYAEKQPLNDQKRRRKTPPTAITVISNSAKERSH